MAWQSAYLRTIAVIFEGIILIMMNIWINRGDKPTKIGFGKGVLEAALSNDNIVGIGADITTSVGMNLFSEAFPSRFLSLGIAEQNCVAAAAGLALAGKIPVFSTYGVFAAHRANDQIRVSVCYNNVHVIIGGAHGGISVGPDGATHQALEDMATMRVLPNMTVLSPCDATQTKIAVVRAVSEVQGPVYIRFGREAVPDFTFENQLFEIGRGQLMREGDDIAIVATGHMLWEALQAADILQREGLSARVINIHTIKPLDEDIIIKAAQETSMVFTVEEHQIIGGLGSAVTECLAEASPTRVVRIGMSDCFGESGSPASLLRKFNLDAEGIARRVVQEYDKR